MSDVADMQMYGIAGVGKCLNCLAGMPSATTMSSRPACGESTSS